MASCITKNDELLYINDYIITETNTRFIVRGADQTMLYVNIDTTNNTAKVIWRNDTLSMKGNVSLHTFNFYNENCEINRNKLEVSLIKYGHEVFSNRSNLQTSFPIPSQLLPNYYVKLNINSNKNRVFYTKREFVNYAAPIDNSIKDTLVDFHKHTIVGLFDGLEYKDRDMDVFVKSVSRNCLGITEIEYFTAIRDTQNHTLPRTSRFYIFDKQTNEEVLLLNQLTN